MLLSLLSCTDPQKKNPGSWQEISGREPERIPLYRVKIPAEWQRLKEDESLIDTRNALCSFVLDGIKITIHNFPVETLESRIPPKAQAQRWSQQIEHLETESTSPQSFSGYQGLFFEGIGAHSAVLGWSLQVGIENYNNLLHSHFPQQVRSDITIKASGPREQIKNHRNEISKIARSFELIHEIPKSR